MGVEGWTTQVRSQRIYHLNAAPRHSDAVDAARMRFIIAVG